MMFVSRFRRFSSRASRFAAVLLALAGYLAAATGVPLPVFPVTASLEKDRSEPFPCMNRPCGCKNALQCWKHCCCTTLAERLAWARKHGVTPPRGIDVAAHEEESGPTCLPAGGCCAAKKSHTKGCTAGHCHASKHASCDASRSSKPTCSQRPAEDRIDFIVISALRQCHGLAPLWSFLAAALSPPPLGGYEFDWQIADWLYLRSESASSVPLLPAIPPPRA